MAGTREATVASASVNPLCSTSLRSVIRRRISACPMIATNDNAKYGPIAPYADRPVIHGSMTFVTIPAMPGTIIPAATNCNSARDRPRATRHLSKKAAMAVAHVATMKKANIG